MLVLKRQIGESIIIDGQIEIKILSDFNGIRIGIEAPKHMNIIRAELKNISQKNKKTDSVC